MKRGDTGRYIQVMDRSGCSSARTVCLQLIRKVTKISESYLEVTECPKQCRQLNIRSEFRGSFVGHVFHHAPCLHLLRAPSLDHHRATRANIKVNRRDSKAQYIEKFLQRLVRCISSVHTYVGYQWAAPGTGHRSGVSYTPLTPREILSFFPSTISLYFFILLKATSVSKNSSHVFLCVQHHTSHFLHTGQHTRLLSGAHFVSYPRGER